MRDSQLKVAVILLSPFFLDLIGNGQIDILVIIGYVLIKQNNITGLPLLLIKPQILLGGAVTFFLKVDRHSKVMIILLLSSLLFIGVALYGNWVFDMYNNVTGDGLVRTASVSDYFHCIPLGIVLFLIGVIKKNVALSGIATIFITPYIAFHSLIVAFAVIIIEVNNKYLIWGLLVSSWIPIIYLMIR